MPREKAGPSVTLAELAKKAGVSRSLASLALRGEPGVVPKKRALILQIAAELNYVPNAVARSLASKSNRTLGIIVGKITNPFLAYLAQEIDKEARTSSYDVVLSIHGYPERAAREAVEALVRQRIAGVILVDAPTEPENIRKIADLVPTIYVGRDLASIGVDSVSTDDFLGARMAIEHLISRGHCKIAHLSGGKGAGADRRMQGYKASMREGGLKPWVVPGEFSIDSGAAGAEHVLAHQRGCTAIFASNDLMAIGAINHLISNGLRVPEDMCVVGFDDMPLASSATLSITTLSQPVRSIASESIGRLLKRIGNINDPPQTILIAPTLAIRQSTGRVISAEL
jgi:DNA-binding LacI/PurR family transcriptional regulator